MNQAHPSAQQPETRRPLILIAEDDRAAAEMLEILLGNAGYDVVIARNGAVALRRIDEHPRPDIVLLDWMLPEVSGPEVCRRIRQQVDALSLPVLMVTAKADSESKAQAFDAGANDYITKPFLGAELRARIAAHLRIKELSEERRAMDERLREKETLSTLGLLVSGVAHDLNNPLGGISGYTQLLLEMEDDAEKREALERILFETRRCNRIVADLLGFARRQSPERVPVAVGDLLARTIEMRERQVNAPGITRRLTVSPGLLPVYADEYQLQQVFVNILINAEQALRWGGSLIRVHAENRIDGEDADHPRLAIHFYNDGPAIGPDVIERIFDPFFTTKSAEEGTGLGLAICARIAREHGGDVEVRSGPEGTTFTVTLPAIRVVAAERDRTLDSASAG